MSGSLQGTEIAGTRPWRGGEVTFADLARVLRRRRASILLPLGVMLALTTAYCLFATRRYQATGEIQVQKESSGAFGLESGVMGDAADAASDALDYNITLQTQASILESEMLAQKVIEDLNLEQTADYFPPAGSVKTGWSVPRWLLFWKQPLEPLSVPLSQAPNRRYAATKIFAGHLKVEPVTSTRLIDISYSNPDPKLAAAVVNRLIAELTDYTFQARFAATAEASTWLAGQLSDLKQQTEALQAKAATLQRDTGIFGSDDSHNIVVARLEALNDALSAAQANRILKEATYRVAESGDPELISGLAGSGAPGLPGAVASSLTLIQTLRAQEATTQAELSADLVRYGANYPKIAELHGQITGIDGSIAAEVQRVGERAHSDYEIAVRSEDAARQAFLAQKALADKLNDKAMSYGLAKQEADSSRDLYEGLLAKLKQAGILEGLRSTNITVVNPGLVPPSNHPKSPNVPLYYAVAGAAGLLLGCMIATLREFTDDKIHSAEDAEVILAENLMCVLPLAPSASQRIAGQRLPTPLRRATDRGLAPAAARPGFAEHASPFMESLRSLRTALKLSRSSQAPQVVLITSSVPGEGKSTVCLNLGFLLAQQGARVLLVDADLRCPALHRLIGGPDTEGLSTALASELARPMPVSVGGLSNLSLLVSGPIAPFPSELLGSRRMDSLIEGWRADYDYVLIDSPPVLPVTDAAVLAQKADAVILVARHEYTARPALKQSHQLLSRQLSERAVLGAVLNAVSSPTAAYYGYANHASRGDLRAQS